MGVGVLSERDDNILFNNTYGTSGLAGPHEISDYIPHLTLEEYYQVRNEEIASLVQVDSKRKQIQEQVSKQAQQYRIRHLELLKLFLTQRNILTYRINTTFKFRRMVNSSILEERISLYTEHLENVKQEIERIIEQDNQYCEQVVPEYLNNEERLQEKTEVLNAILYDVIFLLSKISDLKKADLREIVKDCANLIAQSSTPKKINIKIRPGQIMQDYIVNELQLLPDESYCSVCGQQHIENILYCLNCGKAV